MCARRRFNNLDEEKKEQILEAAAEEFGRFGFESASINKIIERAGISKGAAYYYFNDKSDLYATVLQNAMQRYERFIGGDEEFGPQVLEADTFWDQFVDMGIKGVQFLRAHPWMVRLFKSFFTYSEAHRSDPAVELIWNASRAQTVKWLERGRELGTMRSDIPMELFVDLIYGIGMSLDRWLFEHIEEFSDEDLEEAVLMMVDIIRRVSEPPKEKK